MDSGKVKKVILALTLALPHVALFAIIIYKVAMFAPFGCEDVIVHEELSPNGAVKALVIERDCGATTSWAYRVKIVPAQRPVKLDRGEAGDPYYPALRWIENRSLAIAVTDDKNFAGVENECDDVTYSLSR